MSLAVLLSVHRAHCVIQNIPTLHSGVHMCTQLQSCSLTNKHGYLASTEDTGMFVQCTSVVDAVTANGLGRLGEAVLAALVRSFLSLSPFDPCTQFGALPCFKISLVASHCTIKAEESKFAGFPSS